MSVKIGRNNGSKIDEMEKKSNHSFSIKQKEKILKEGMKGEFEFSEIAFKEGIDAKLFYKWGIDFLKSDPVTFLEVSKLEDSNDEIIRLQIENKLLKHFIKEIEVKNNKLRNKLEKNS